MSRDASLTLIVDYEKYYDDNGYILVRDGDFVGRVEKYVEVYFKNKGYEVFRDDSGRHHADTFLEMVDACISTSPDLRIRRRDRTISAAGITIKIADWEHPKITPESFSNAVSSPERVVELLVEYEKENRDCDPKKLIRFRQVIAGLGPNLAKTLHYVSECKGFEKGPSRVLFGWPDLLIWKADGSERFWAEVKSQSDQLSKDQKRWASVNEDRFEMKFSLIRVLPRTPIKIRKEIVDFVKALELDRYGKRMKTLIRKGILESSFIWTRHRLLEWGESGIRSMLGSKSAECLIDALKRRGDLP